MNPIKTYYSISIGTHISKGQPSGLTHTHTSTMLAGVCHATLPVWIRPACRTRSAVVWGHSWRLRGWG